mmetsp:Transcript_10731/g.16172  ORF Transcript_10731/g.16172 Transcript_10731/m.16172 type:complete len:264 (-) Transcript_10731:3-794(-)
MKHTFPIFQSARRIVLVSPTFGASPLENVLKARKTQKFYTFPLLFERKYMRYHPAFFFNELTSVTPLKITTTASPRHEILPTLKQFDGVLGLPGCSLWRQMVTNPETVVVYAPTYTLDSPEYVEAREELKKLADTCFWLKAFIQESAPLYNLLEELLTELEKMVANPDLYRNELQKGLKPNQFVEIGVSDSKEIALQKLSKVLGTQTFDTKALLNTDAESLRALRRTMIGTLAQMVALSVLFVCLFALFMYASYIKQRDPRLK